MSIALKLQLVVFAFFLIGLIILILRKGLMSIKYSLMWFTLGFFVLLAGLMPNLVQDLAIRLGFQVASNMIFALLIGFLILVSISLTIIVSQQNNKIKFLIQEVSRLKKDSSDK